MPLWPVNPSNNDSQRTAHAAKTQDPDYPRIATIIVNFHKAERLVAGLKLLRLQTMAPQMKIVVVDNSVSRQEAETLERHMRPNESLIISAENLGYSRAVNLAARNVGRHDYILLASPDILVEDPRAIQEMVSLLQTEPRIAVLATLQRNDDGSPVEVARQFPSFWRQILRRSNPRAFQELHIQSALDDSVRIIDVDWVQSSFVMIPRAFWDEVSGLDEAYKIFMADVAICWRAHKQGLRVAVTSLVNVRADGLRASRGGICDIFRSRPLRIHMRDAALYYLRH
jgi:GT2 family glycosyltransferase